MEQALFVPSPELAVHQWTDWSYGGVAARLGMNAGSRGILAVDGRSGSGKTTFAAGIVEVVAGSAVVHTDDIAWHHSFFGWNGLLVEGVIAPFLAGEGVSYRPPPWDERGREGAVEVSADTTWLVIEGVGAARTELAEHLDAIVWVQSDYHVAEARGIERDGGDQAAIDFWHEWMVSETPFHAGHRPWQRADLVINGSPSSAASNGVWVAHG